MRDSCIFYRSFYESINSLPLEQQGEIYSAIFEYSFNQNEVELLGISKAIFTLIKPQLDANNKRFDNGSKGGRPKTKDNQNETKTKPKQKQTETKIEPNNNYNDNDNYNLNDNKNNNIHDRKLKFADTLKPFKDVYGHNMLNNFYLYWTEPNKSNTKFRQELEKTWDVARRLETWAKNDKNFNKNTDKSKKEIEQERILQILAENDRIINQNKQIDGLT